MLLNYITWDVSPIIFSIGSLQIRWYGLLWALSFILGYLMISKMFKRENISDKQVDQLAVYMIIFTIIGARLGHCLFYEPEYYLSNPIKILEIWEGGLASHGGAIGILIGLYLYSRKTKRPYIWILDRIVVPVALAGCFIRLGNLMNSEIYGYTTNLPWGFKFVRDYQYHGLPVSQIPVCHPTQIYEASIYLLTFIFLYLCYFKWDMGKKRPGFIFGLFLICVFGSRILVELLKQPQVEFEKSMVLNMGQWLSVPFVILGIVVLVLSYRKKKSKQ